MSYEDRLKQFVVALHGIGGVKFGEFKVKVGIISPIYFDFRVIISYPQLLEDLSDLIGEVLKRENLLDVDHICGVPYTALPIATLVANKFKKPMLMKRKEMKDYGTKKLIEGEFNTGDTCIVIEDVITSGSSILETKNALKKEGIEVNGAVVVLDRQQGGRSNLEDQGLYVKSLLNIDSLLEILLDAGKIKKEVITSVRDYLDVSQVAIPDKLIQPETAQRLKLSFSARATKCQNSAARRLLKIMEKKQTLLCLAADVKTSKDLLRVARQVGNHICLFKTHSDGIVDFSEETSEELMKIAWEMDFMLMEDRKFSDIGNTVCLQYSLVNGWADFVTAHSLPGDGLILGLKAGLKENKERGCFLVAELSCEGTLISKEYTKSTFQMAKRHSDFVVGLVCQSSEVMDDNEDLIQLTPGVRINVKSDELKQKYNDPETVVTDRGADVVVVGRGILESEDLETTAALYKEKLWQAYLKRIT